MNLDNREMFTMEHPRYDSTNKFLTECENFGEFLETASPVELEAYADGVLSPNLKEIEKEAERALVEEEDECINRLIDRVQEVVGVLEEDEDRQRNLIDPIRKEVYSEERKRELRLETIRIASSTTVPDLMID